MLLSIWAERWRTFNLQTMRFKQKLFNSSREMPCAFSFITVHRRRILLHYSWKNYISVVSRI